MEFPRRKKIRLDGFDYSACGAYFVTVCSYQHQELFGDIVVGQGLCSCRLSDIGIIVDKEIQDISHRYANARIDKYVIMPNHIHLIISLTRQEQSPCPTVGEMICILKSLTTKKANKLLNINGRKIWQYRFHDHIIRNKQGYLEIQEYIENNPIRWKDDCFYIEKRLP